jgi:phage terminase large subunit-like protein
MFNEARAQRVIGFIQLLHLTGDFYGKPFILQDWQKEALRDIYGTVKENGLRQYKYAYLEIPKKNGKTELAAGIGLYHLTCDAPGGQIYCCAADREQASLVYIAAKSMIEQEPELEKFLKVTDSKKEIHNRKTKTFLKVLSAEAYSKHGINPTVVIFDELHAQPNRGLWDTMTFGTGSARKEPLFWVITTAGDDPDHKSIGWEIHQYASGVASGEVDDPIWYAKIYNAPGDVDIFDEAAWYRANPSLGVSISIDALREEITAVKNNPAVEKLFRWLRLNQWVQLKRIGWLPITLWDDTEDKWAHDELDGKRCYVGIDLSTRTDLTAVVPLFPPQGDINEYRFILNTFCPENNIPARAKRDHVNYEKWVTDGYLTATPGDVVDYKAIAQHIEEIEKIYNVQYYCGDPWHLEVLKQMLNDNIQRKFIEIPQTMAGMSAGMAEYERLVRGKEITHERNPLGRWAFGNVIVATDGNENIKPMKNKSIERIDPIVALINAMTGAIKLEPQRSVYDSRGMRSLL